MSKYVESWWVQELPNGVIELVINCTQREIYYHQYGDYDFLIAGTEDEFNGLSDGESCSFSIPSFLPPIDGIYLHADSKNKDQLYFFYIPHLRVWNRDKKILLESK